MDDRPDFAAIAALVGEPARARMLAVLMDGRARTATELGLEGSVAASTASSHLSRLTSAGLLSVARQGRHRYYRIASAEVAAAVEALMGLASGGVARAGRRRASAREDPLWKARVCYDHLAGEAGVRLLDRLRAFSLVAGADEEPELTQAGESWCERIGVDVAQLRERRRPLCRACLDWSERRFHLGGSVGAALLDRLFERRQARRVRGGRAVILTRYGEAFVEHPALAG